MGVSAGAGAIISLHFNLVFLYNLYVNVFDIYCTFCSNDNVNKRCVMKEL